MHHTVHKLSPQLPTTHFVPFPLYHYNLNIITFYHNLSYLSIPYCPTPTNQLHAHLPTLPAPTITTTTYQLLYLLIKFTLLPIYPL